MFWFKVIHEQGYKLCRSFDAAVALCNRRKRAGHWAEIRVVWVQGAQ